MAIDLAKVSSSARLAALCEPEREGVARLLTEATSFLTSFQWCQAITSSYVGIAVPGVVGVFLFQIDPSEASVDNWIWVVVGDLPPAYLVTDLARNPACALRIYIDEMTTWIEAVKAGRPVDDLIPVNVEPTSEYAAALERRLGLLESDVLAGFEADLRESDT